MKTEYAITVAALIEQLKALPQDLPVVIEGCDCYGDASGATLIEDKEPYVLIER